jgi:16S rRNA (guanine966-N2)-methyltransferase
MESNKKMRIISGNLKGKSINFIRNITTRPLKDSVRENIFNILKHSNLFKIKIKNSNILDLYSGIGSFGIESISREAKKVTFIEQDINAYNILKDNLRRLSILDKSIILNDKIENILINKIKEKFNIFFLDPPYADIGYLNNLRLIKENNIFKKNHIVVIHREKKTKDNFDNLLKVIDTKLYGRSKILFGLFN